jgi:ABC-type multidrug transport system ATPase subunit
MKVTGEYRLNGREYDTNVLKSMSAYVMQDDLLHPELTVGETLRWAAELRMPHICTKEERAARVRHVTDLMGIGHCENTIVGDTRKKGISGGERKRLCVAIELLNRPKLIFLDEPTSGLDSTTAFTVCQALHHLAESGECTVVCTIHQPAPNAFALFDNLILMKNGEAVFQGACEGVIPFLEQIGFPYKNDCNLAEHLIDAISPVGGVSFEKLSEHSMNAVPIDLSLGNEMYDFTEFTDLKGLLRKTWILIQRNFKQEVRNWDRFLLCLAATILIAFFTSGGIWEQLGTNQASAKKIPPAIFFCFVNQGVYSSLIVLNSFPGERAIMLRERQAGAYTTLSYFLAKTFTDTLVMLPMPIIFSIIVYPMYGLTPDVTKFFVFMFFISAGSTCATALATFGTQILLSILCVLRFLTGLFYVRTVSCACVTVELSTIVCGLLMEVCRLFGGFYTSPRQLHDYMEWKFADCISYMKYAFVGTMLSENGGLKFDCDPGEVCAIQTGEQLNAFYGYDQYNSPYCVGILFLYFFVCRAAAYLALKFIRY